MSPFTKAVYEGFSASPKFLPSWMFYDDRGDQLFRQIMAMPEYYLTDCEKEIFESQGSSIGEFVAGVSGQLEIVEPGAGDGAKTEILLEKWSSQGCQLKYVPIDISPHVLNLLKDRLSHSLPKIDVRPLALSFEQAFEKLHQTGSKRLFLFLGSNIGNMPMEKSIEFLRKIRNMMKEEDLLLVGFDLKKDPEIILSAYDDPHGITAAFNLNLLRRINRELGADFKVENFSHYASYDPVSGQARSYLISKKQQMVYISELGRSFAFDQWEPIHTEISAKFSTGEINRIATQSGFQILMYFEDKRAYYRNVILGPKLKQDSSV